jgi:NTP pyrophosphatase (non-canonical NTP hydrolase)
MTLDDYQMITQSSAVYPDVGRNLVFPTLGLAGESGEVAEKVKKLIRDNGGVVDEAAKTALMKELGDVLWYLAALSRELGCTLEEVAAMNLEKIASRRERGVVHGAGDNR